MQDGGRGGSLISLWYACPPTAGHQVEGRRVAGLRAALGAGRLALRPPRECSLSCEAWEWSRAFGTGSTTGAGLLAGRLASGHPSPGMDVCLGSRGSLRMNSVRCADCWSVGAACEAWESAAGSSSRCGHAAGSEQQRGEALQVGLIP